MVMKKNFDEAWDDFVAARRAEIARVAPGFAPAEGPDTRARHVAARQYLEQRAVMARERTGWFVATGAMLAAAVALVLFTPRWSADATPVSLVDLWTMGDVP